MTTKTAILKHLGLFGFLLILITFGCKKEDTTSSSNDYYIKAKVNGVLVTATYSSPNSELVSNAYITEDQMFQIERGISATSSGGWNILVRNLDLDHLTYPKILTYADSDIDILYNNGTSGAKGNFVLDDYDTYPFSLTLTKWSNDILEGTFQGKLRWGGGQDSTANIANGEFRIKMTRY